MTANEFTAFWSYAATAYADIHKLFEDDHDGGKMRMDHWRKALTEVPLDDAKAAIDAMLAGQLKRPWLFDEFTVSIIDYARDLAGNRILSKERQREETDGPRVRCKVCNDTGLAAIWHPIIVNLFRTRWRVVQAPNDWMPPAVRRATDYFKNMWREVATDIQYMVVDGDGTEIDWERESRAALRAAKQPTRDLELILTCSCDCRMASASRKRKQETRRGLPIFDETQAAPYLHGKPKQLIEWIESHPPGEAWQPAGTYEQFS